MPTVHGIPVGIKAALQDAGEAQRLGEAFQEECRQRLGGREVPLDLKVLGIEGKCVEEYAASEIREQDLTVQILQEVRQHMGALES